MSESVMNTRDKSKCIDERFRRIDRIFCEYAKACGINFPVLLILLEIFENPGCTQKQIVEQTMLLKQTVNQAVREFLDSGYVELRQNPANRREKSVFFTPEGEAYAASVLRPVFSAGDGVFSALSEEAYDTVMRVLFSYEQAMENCLRKKRV